MAKRSKSNEPPPPPLIDRITDLPNSILLHILSLLPLKSTAATAVLSKRWLALFHQFLAHTPHLDFGPHLLTPRTPHQFIQTVNRYLGLHTAPTLNTFRLRFDPGPQAQAQAQKWLDFAIRRSVQRLDLDLSGSRDDLNDDDDSRRLKLADSLFSSGSDGCGPGLTHLRLGLFDFDPPVGFAGFGSLVSLQLRRVGVTDEALGRVLMTCPVLTELWLCECGGLRSIKVMGGEGFRLERLFVGDCYDGYEIEILAPNLKSFHFYGNLLYEYLFREVSALEDVYLSSIGFECTEPEHDYIHILSSVSGVKVLTVCTAPLMYITTAEEFFPEKLPVNLPNLEELQIMAGSPLYEDHLSYFYGFFKHTVCPCLDKLFIELCADHFELSWQSQLKEGQAEVLAISSFYNLKTIKITNFRGTKLEMRLVKFFLSKSISLEQMVVVAAQDSDMEKQIAGARDSSTTFGGIFDEILILPKASMNTKVVVYGYGGDDNKTLVHTHTNVLQNVVTVNGRTCVNF